MQLQARVESLREAVTKEPLLGRAAAEGFATSLELEDEGVNVMSGRRPSSRGLLAPLATTAAEDKPGPATE